MKHKFPNDVPLFWYLLSPITFSVFLLISAQQFGCGSTNPTDGAISEAQSEQTSTPESAIYEKSTSDETTIDAQVKEPFSTPDEAPLQPQEKKDEIPAPPEENFHDSADAGDTPDTNKEEPASPDIITEQAPDYTTQDQEQPESPVGPGACTWTTFLTISAHSGYVRSVAFWGNKLVTASEDKTVKVWDATTGQMSGSGKDLALINSLAVSAKAFATGSSDKLVKIWDPSGLSIKQSFSGHTGSVRAVAFSPDGTILASGSTDHSARLWDLSKGTIFKILDHSISGIGLVEAIAFSPNGKIFATGGWDNIIKLWDLSNYQTTHTIKGHTSYILSLAFTPDNTALAAGGWATGTPASADLKLWDVSNGQMLRTFTGHSGNIKSVQIDASGTYLFSGSNDTSAIDNSVRVWELATGKLVQTLSAGGGVNSIALSPDGKLLAAGISQNNNNVQLWQCK